MHAGMHRSTGRGIYRYAYYRYIPNINLPVSLHTVGLRALSGYAYVLKLWKSIAINFYRVDLPVDLPTAG